MCGRGARCARLIRPPKGDAIWFARNPEPILRLITCDPTTVEGGLYEGNWVVWASLV